MAKKKKLIFISFNIYGNSEQKLIGTGEIIDEFRLIKNENKNSNLGIDLLSIKQKILNESKSSLVSKLSQIHIINISILTMHKSDIKA